MTPVDSSHPSQLKAVLFDMDDTLIDWRDFSGDWHTMQRRHLENVYNFLEASGRPLNTSCEHFRRAYSEAVMDAWAEARTTLRAPHIGKVLVQTLERFGFLADETIDEADCLTAYEWAAVPGVKAFPDVAEGLQTLIDRGVTIGIVTNAFVPMHLRDRELEAFDLLRFFPTATHRISAADVGYLKPHPRIFHHALEAIGASPETTVYVGDNPGADVQGAQSVGMKAVLRVNHGEIPGLSRVIQPDAQIQSLTELSSVFAEWFEEW